MLQSALIKYLLLCSLIATITGVTITVWIFTDAWYFTFCALVGIILTAILFWKLFNIENNPNASRLFFTGLLTGSVSHYICWMMLIVIHAIDRIITRGWADTFDNPLDTTIEFVTTPFSLTLYSMIVCGWFTVPACIFAAFVTRFWHRSSGS